MNDDNRMPFNRFVVILFVLGGWWCQLSVGLEVRRHDPSRTTFPLLPYQGWPQSPGRFPCHDSSIRAWKASTSTGTCRLTAITPQNQDDPPTIQYSPSPASTFSSSSSSSTHLPKLIVTCGTTDELIHAIDEYVKSHHVVAEIGSQLRQVSTRIGEQSRSVTIMDVQRKFPKLQNHRTEAMRIRQVPVPSSPSTTTTSSSSSSSFSFPTQSTFHEVGQLSDWPQVFFSTDNTTNTAITKYGYDILVLDVNAIVGNDLEWTSLQIIQQFHSLNSLRRRNNHHHNNKKDRDADDDGLIVLVKSSGLNQWANRIHSGQYWNDHHQDLMSLGGGKGTTNSMSSFIVATVGVQEYRSTIPTTVRSTDCVLEVGCHYGTTTVLLQQHAAHCIGVDVGPKIIAQAQQRFPEVHFRVGNAWKTGELLRFLQDYKNHQENATMDGYNVVYVDVGGLSGSDGLLEAIQLTSSLSYALEPRCIVIKSLCMQRLSTTLMSFWHLKRQKRKQQQETTSKKVDE